MRRLAGCLRLAFLLAVGLTAAPRAPAATAAPARLQMLLARMHQAYSRSEWKEYRADSAQLLEFLNGSTDALLEAARASARSGDPLAALQDLQIMARMGVSQPKVATLADFAPLRSRPDFRRVVAELAANARPVSHSHQAFVISDAGLLPEDIAYDSAAGEFLLTSVLEGRIVAVAPSGRMRTFARAPDRWPMLAIRVDPGHRVVWATEVALTGFRSVPRRDWGRSVVLEYDLRSGRLLRRIEGPRNSQLGDIALSPAGDLLLCDSNGGGLYRVRRGSAELARLSTDEFVSPMTPAFVTQRQAFVADYVRGIALLDLAANRVTWEPMEKRYALQGADGLYWYQGRLLAVQNGLSPERVLSFTLDARRVRIAAQEVIESGTPALDPTHGVIVAGYFYYIENSGWNELAADGTVRRGATLTPAIIMRTRL